MAKMVGLSRNLKLSWLNQTVELVSSNLVENEIKEKLNEYLSFEIGSPTNKMCIRDRPNRSYARRRRNKEK